MSCNPAEILELAKQIRDGFTTEAARRTVVSRAYYSALHCARQAFPGVSDASLAKNQSSHELVIAHLETYSKALQPGRENAAKAAVILRKMKTARILSDYSLSDSVAVNAAGDAIARAQAVQNHCNNARKLLEKAAEDQAPELS